MSASYWKMLVASILLTIVAGGIPYIDETAFSPVPMLIDTDYATVTNVILVAASLEICVTKYSNTRR